MDWRRGDPASLEALVAELNVGDVTTSSSEIA